MVVETWWHNLDVLSINEYKQIRDVLRNLWTKEYGRLILISILKFECFNMKQKTLFPQNTDKAAILNLVLKIMSYQ